MDLKTVLRRSYLLVVLLELGSSMNNANAQYQYVQPQPRNLIMRLPTRTRDEVMRIARSQPASIYNHPIFQYPDIFKEILNAYTSIYKHKIQTLIQSNTLNGLQVNRKYFIRSDLLDPQNRFIVAKSCTNSNLNNDNLNCDEQQQTVITCDSNDPGTASAGNNRNVDNINCKCPKYEGVYNGCANKNINNGNTTSHIKGIGEKSDQTCEVDNYSSFVQLHVQIKDKLLRRIRKITKDLDDWNPELTEGTEGPAYEECGYINKLRLIGLSLIDLGNFLLDDNPSKELCVIVGDELDGDIGLYPPGCFKI